MKVGHGLGVRNKLDTYRLFCLWDEGWITHAN